MVYSLVDRIKNIFELTLSQYPSYSAVPDGYKSPRLLAYLLSFHIFRPAWIQTTIKHNPAGVQDPDGVPEFHDRLRQINTLTPLVTGLLATFNRARAYTRLVDHLILGGLNALPVTPIEDNIVTFLADDLQKIRVELGTSGGIFQPAGVQLTAVSPPANQNRYGTFASQINDSDLTQKYGGVVRTPPPPPSPPLIL